MIHLVPSPERDKRNKKEEEKTHGATENGRGGQEKKMNRQKRSIGYKRPFLSKRRRQEDERTRCQNRADLRRYLRRFKIIIISCACKQKAVQDKFWERLRAETVQTNWGKQYKPSVPASQKQHKTNCACEAKGSTKLIGPTIKKLCRTNFERSVT